MFIPLLPLVSMTLQILHQFQQFTKNVRFNKQHNAQFLSIILMVGPIKANLFYATSVEIPKPDQLEKNVISCGTSKNYNQT